MNIIKNTKLDNSRYEVTIADQLHEYLKESFFYEVDNIDISHIPEEILQIPFIINIAPVIWLSGMTFYIDKIDSNLYIALNDLKKHFQTTYPDIKFNGELLAREKIDIKYNLNNSKFIQLFSGGVDSVFSLLKNINLNLSLLTVIGSDTALDDNEGYENIKNTAKKYTSNRDNLKNYFLKSNFKVFLNTKKIKKQFKRDWWTAIQAVLGTSSFMSIFSFLEGSAIGFIGSTGFPNNAKNFSQYGTIPDVDNDALNWGEFKTEYHEVNFSRQDKIEYIHMNMFNYYNDTLPLRVCYSINGAENCSRCGKCYMTMIGLLTSGSDYRDYGFNISHSEFIKNIQNDLKKLKYELQTPISLFFRIDAQKRIKERSYYQELNFSNELIDFLMWYKEFDLALYYKKYKKIIQRKRFFRNIEKKITSIFKAN